MALDRSRFLACVLPVVALASLGVAASTFAQKPPSPQEVERRTKMGGYHPERMKNPHLTGHPGKMTVTPP